MKTSGHTRLRQLVLAHLRRAKWSVGLAVICLLGAILMELLAPWPLKVIFDHVLMGKALSPSLSFLDALFHWGTLPAVVVLSAAVFLIVVVGGAFSYVQVYLTAKTGYELAAMLRQELFSHLQRLSLDYYDAEMAGRIMTRMTTDVEALSQLLQTGLINAVVSLLSFFGVLIVLAVINPRLMLATTAVLPPLLLAKNLGPTPGKC